jgi:hypothetical protein
MKRLSLLTMTWATLVLALLVGPAVGQPDGPGAGLYNPQTVETVSGLVVSITPMPPKGGPPQRVQLGLKTDGETITVILGPSSYIEGQGVEIKDLDRVEVRGSRIVARGQPMLIAAWVKKGGQVLKLRDESGRPLWRTGGRPAVPPGREVYPQGQGPYWPGRPGGK